MKLNFNEVKRPTLDIVLNDKEQTELTLITPAKYQVDEFINMFECITKKNTKDITMDDLYLLASNVLSSNKEGKVIDVEKVKSIFMLDDIIILFKTYNEFILGIYNLKN